MNIIEKIMLRIIQRKLANWFTLEHSLASYKNAILFNEFSPPRSWPNLAKIPFGNELPFTLKNIPLVGKSLKNCIRQEFDALNSLKDNPTHCKTIISELELHEFKTLAAAYNIKVMGFTKVAPELIFKDHAVLYDTAIVLLMEMDQAAIEEAPSRKTFGMVMGTYAKLGKAVNQLTTYLRHNGFCAQGGHPLGGLLVYPPLAVKAGLGWCGRHGLLITPQFGPRQRVAAIFTNIANLPVNTLPNPHSWVGNFCRTCGRCIRKCPSQAILETPILQPAGRKTCIVRDKCLPVFVKQNGCTVCVKECAFSSQGYSELHKAMHSPTR